MLKNGYRVDVDIMTGKICRQFRLLKLPSLIGQIVHTVNRRREVGVKGGGRYFSQLQVSLY